MSLRRHDNNRPVAKRAPKRGAKKYKNKNGGDHDGVRVVSGREGGFAALGQGKVASRKMFESLSLRVGIE